MKGISVFQTVLIAVFGAVAIAAVLIFAFAVGGGSGTSVGAVTVWGTLDQNAFTTVIRQAAETNPDLAQVSYVQKNPDTYYQDLTNALASGQGPDLALIREDYAYTEATKLIPIPYTSLPQSQFESTFVDAASPFESDSGVLGIPLLVDPMVLYWNKDLMSTAGYAKPPQYWDELYNIAQQITKRDDTGTITKSAIDFGEYVNVTNAKDVLAMLIMQAGGKITTRDSNGKIVPSIAPRVGDPTQATASALRFFTEFADPSKGDYTWNRSLPDGRKAFAAGDLALYAGYASEDPIISSTNPNLNYALSAMPQIRDSSRAVVMGHVYALAVPRTAANPTGAVQVAYLLAAAGISQNLSIALGIPSARRDVLSQAAQGNDVLFNKQAIIAHSWVDPDPAQTAALFRAMIENTTSGATLLTEAVQQADQQMEHILGL